ncbi:hypothetical protein SCHPADRAFT_1002674 [Schizopora paradoxa]|uniref:Uncharacterized protein n=1 Tax=Schizopora paradoxa TaxID=27342 RepID=A0A0H2RLV8_9AGAM|nr:hypothetical protein SCHPADRAFT_1002674 [Schizopora paradoxa]
MRSDHNYSASSSPPLTTNTPSSSSFSPSSPATASRQRFHNYNSVGLLTPVSSKASLLAPRSPAYIDGRRQPSYSSLSNSSSPQPRRNLNHTHQRSASAVVHRFTATPATRSPVRRTSLRRSIQPSGSPRPPLLVLEVQQPRPALSFAADPFLMSGVSRASSPQGRQRALSPTRPTISRPPSRCESLLRDTLRKDDLERETSSTAGVPIPKNRRSRGRSVLGARSPNVSDFPAHLRADETSEVEHYDEAGMFSANGRGSMDFLYRSPSSASNGRARLARGLPIGSPPEVPNPYLPYGSPASPTPLPPTMLRTRTAPAVPRAASSSSKGHGALALDGVHDRSGSSSTRPPRSPARHTMPNMAGPSMTGAPVAGPSGTSGSSESSPKLHTHSVSPHEAVLRAKLESVLRTGSTSPEERASSSHKPSNSSAGRSRHHQRAHTHGVTFQAAQDDPASISPQASTLMISMFRKDVLTCGLSFLSLPFDSALLRDRFTNTQTLTLLAETLTSTVQSFTYPLSNSASDLARHAYTTPSHRRNSKENASTTSSGEGSRSESGSTAHSSTAHAHAPHSNYSRHHPAPHHRNSKGGSCSPASPDEPLTPPSTPPFNAWTASEVCKQMDGYVSFANIEGLGEPGLDMNGDDVESVEGLRKWGRWLKLLPFVHGTEGAATVETSSPTSQVDARAY